MSEAKDSDPEEEQPPPPEDGEQEHSPPPLDGQVRAYNKMWYTGGHAWGVRRKFLDKEQIFQVGGKGLSTEQLEFGVDRAIAKLNGGSMFEAQAKTWTQAEVNT